MSSLLAAIRDAVRPGAQTHALDLVEDEPGASALNPATPLAEAYTSGGDMSANQTLAGAAQPATAALAAVAAAASGGQGDYQAGFQAAMDRVSATLGAAGIKGDARRMNAALDLALASPGMSAEAVASFVTANVAASAASPEPAPQASQPAASQPAPSPAAAYEQQRLAAASLAMPGGGAMRASQPKISTTSIFAMRRNAQKGA